MSQRRKSIRKSKKNQPPTGTRKTSFRQKLVTGAVILFAFLFAVSMFFSTPNSITRGTSGSSTPAPSTSNAKPSEPQFVKEGELQFLKDGNIVVALDIEVANTDQEIEKGLMFRQKMDQNKGMLFIFSEMKPRGFWMKNTYIPLDIIYIDADKTIVSIQKNTIPFSEQTLPSTGPAMYVLEVNAGFSDLHGLMPGDTLDFQVNQ